MTDLTEEEKQVLISAPVYMSLLPAVKDGEIEDVEKERAGKITSLRTSVSDPLLKDYYKDVERHFEENWKKAVAGLPKGTSARVAHLKNKIDDIEKVISGGDRKFALALGKSLQRLSKQIEKADRSLVQYFLIPFGISEDDDEMKNDTSPDSRHYSI